MPNVTSADIIKLANSGKKVKALSLIKQDTELAAVLSKLITARTPPRHNQVGQREITPPDTMMYRNLSSQISNNIADTENIFKLLPDLNLAKQILISSILSPKDMMVTEINITTQSSEFPSDVSGTIINKLKEFFDNTYKIKPLLSKILEDVLFDTGSFPICVIPESSIDELINGVQKLSVESMKTVVETNNTFGNIGFLGKPDGAAKPIKSVSGVSFESLAYRYTAESYQEQLNSNKITISKDNTSIDTFISVTDNYNILKIPALNKKIRSQFVKDKLGCKSMESLNISDRQLAGITYKNGKKIGFKPLVTVNTEQQNARRSVGEPLVLKLPSESVIPVYIPGTPEQHIGFFVLIDQEGNPISQHSPDEVFRNLSPNVNSSAGTNNFTGVINDRVKNMMGQGNEAASNVNTKLHLNYATKVYTDIIESDLLARLRNGVYGNSIALAKNQEIYRIMLARSLQQQQTQVLFIPIELMTYFAFKYSKDGIGLSLIDDMRVLLSLRVMTMFADTMASIKNSIGRTNVALKFDEDDPDPGKTAEEAIDAITNTRRQYFPLGINNPTDIVDWLQVAGFEFTFSQHPKLPDMTVEFSERNTNYVKPETELTENLRKFSIMAMGLTPENVDAGFTADFATTILNNNLLLSKRVMAIQDKLTPLVSDHAKKYAKISQELYTMVYDTINENLDKIVERQNEGTNPNDETPPEVLATHLTHDFIDSLEFKLPSPNVVTLENQMLAYKTYVESLDSILDDAYISDKFLNDTTVGEVANDVGTIKEIIKAYYIRKWLSENGVLTELNDMLATNEDGNSVVNFFEEHQNYITSISKSMSNLLIKLQEPKNDISGELEAAGVEVSEPASTSEETPTDETGSGEDDLLGGDFDMGSLTGGEDSGTGSEDTTDTTETTETKEATPEETPNTDNTANEKPAEEDKAKKE